jgi:hypothetical protein
LIIRDITQAYTQSLSDLVRPFFIYANKELAKQLGIKEGDIVQVIRPLYGIPEAGNHWYKTYLEHHLNALRMKQSTYDLCLLFSKEPFGVIGLQTDDTLGVVDEKFANLEQDELEKAGFMAKEREVLSEATPIKFNGGLIQKKGNKVILNQQRQCETL